MGTYIVSAPGLGLSAACAAASPEEAARCFARDHGLAVGDMGGDAGLAEVEVLEAEASPPDWAPRRVYTLAAVHPSGGPAARRRQARAVVLREALAWLERRAGATAESPLGAGGAADGVAGAIADDFREYVGRAGRMWDA